MVCILFCTSLRIYYRATQCAFYIMISLYYSVLEENLGQLCVLIICASSQDSQLSQHDEYWYHGWMKCFLSTEMALCKGKGTLQVFWSLEYIWVIQRMRVPKASSLIREHSWRRRNSGKTLEFHGLSLVFNVWQLCRRKSLSPHKKTRECPKWVSVSLLKWIISPVKNCKDFLFVRKWFKTCLHLRPNYIFPLYVHRPVATNQRRRWNPSFIPASAFTHSVPSLPTGDLGLSGSWPFLLREKQSTITK